MKMHGLDDTMTVIDVGAGWTEFDYTLRAEYGWKGRYIPIDGGIDGTDLERWWPSRYVDWVVGLEIIEHMEDPQHLLDAMYHAATRGVVLSTPNPRTTDVLGMDSTHKTPIEASWLRSQGLHVQEASFYGQPADSLFAYHVVQ